jgi:hypothetical protein
VRHPHEGRDGEVATGLLEHSLAGVDEQHEHVGRRGPGDGVARVLHVAGTVGEDERALGGREVAVGDVDGDALLALGAQAVGEQREVGRVEPRSRLTRSTASSWSARTDLESCSSRPTRVDLPSSTIRRWRSAAKQGRHQK